MKECSGILQKVYSNFLKARPFCGVKKFIQSPRNCLGYYKSECANILQIRLRLDPGACTIKLITAVIYGFL
jgi:hypothetical protein